MKTKLIPGLNCQIRLTYARLCFGLRTVPLFLHGPHVFLVTVMDEASLWKNLSPHTAENDAPEEFNMLMDTQLPGTSRQPFSTGMQI